MKKNKNNAHKRNFYDWRMLVEDFDDLGDLNDLNVNNTKIKMENIDSLVEENSGLIWSIVKRFKNRGQEEEDLYQIGVIGFIKAVKRFDISYNVKLSTYAVPYIIGELKVFFRDDGIIKVSREIKNLNYKIKMLEKEYENNDKELTIGELEKKLHASKEDILMAQNLNYNVISINRSYYDSDDSNNDKDLENDIVSSIKNDDFESEESNIVKKIMLKDALKKLDKKEKEIIILRYFKEMTQADIAKKYNISQVQISRLEKKILQKMRDDICEDNIYKKENIPQSNMRKE